MQTKGIITSREIGEKIRKRRKEIKMSQEKLSEILNVTYQQVQRYENGISRLNVENIQIIADALSVPLSYFFGTYKPPAITEEKAPYLSSSETTLLKYYRKIKDNRFREIILHVARIAAR